jgi:hypothetical protein
VLWWGGKGDRAPKNVLTVLMHDIKALVWRTAEASRIFTPLFIAWHAQRCHLLFHVVRKIRDSEHGVANGARRFLHPFLPSCLPSQRRFPLHGIAVRRVFKNKQPI